MLKELPNVSQHEGEGHRRWFVDDYFDLIVWHELDHPDQIVGFQLCYDKAHDEHALTWRRHVGFRHHGIDDGAQNPIANRTPVLVPDGVVPIQDLHRRFTAACADIDPAIARLVLERLQELLG